MAQLKNIPVSLKVVAWLFIIWGIYSVIRVVVVFNHGAIYVNLGVLGLFIGPGLLKLRPAWRTCALVFLWIGLIAISIAILASLSRPGTLVLCVVYFLLVLWQYSVLTRPEIRALFGLPSGKVAAEGFSPSSSPLDY